MANVTLDGQDIGEVTDPNELAYYRREPGAVVDGVATPDAAEVPETVEVAPEDPGTGGVEGVPEIPADDALKSEWVAYAKFTDPGNADEIDAMTKSELIDAYGGE